MNIQPLDLPSLIRAVGWPVITVVALIVLRQPLADLAPFLGQRINKLSFGIFSLELAELSELRPPALEIEVRQLGAAPQIQSGSDSISGIFNQLQQGAGGGYIVIDLGSEASPRWLTSRLYLLAFLITLIGQPIYLVFVETLGAVRNRYVGTASPENVRWALARRYGWLESAMALAFAVAGGAYCDPKTGLQIYGTGSFQFDLVTGHLSSWQVMQLMQQFLGFIRAQQPAVGDSVPDPAEWITFNDSITEHAKWLDAARLERLAGSGLSTSTVVLLPNQSPRSLGEAVLSQQGPFVAVVETDRMFRSLADRSATLEILASACLKQTRSENNG